MPMADRHRRARGNRVCSLIACGALAREIIDVIRMNAGIT